MRALILSACALAALAAGCDRTRAPSTEAASSEVRQTRFPGQVTAGGGSSGELIATTETATNARNSGGTPGTGGGMEGNTGGAKMGGTVPETAPSTAGTNTQAPAAPPKPPGQ